MPQELFYLPNLLSLGRLFIALPAAYCLATYNFPCAGILYILGALSDFFDGFLARRLGLESKLGVILDPLADKVLILSYISVLYVGDFRFRPSELLVGAVLLKEFTVLLGLPLIRRGFIPKPNIFGKISTTLLFTDGILLLYANWRGNDLHLLREFVEGLATISLLIATVLYTVRGMSKIRGLP